MSLGKLPGLKGLVSGSQGKRRFKSELSVDMISPPLGDFKHTMHVGRGGDVFGDTSFLSNYGGTREPGSPDSANSSKTTSFFARTFRQVRKNSAPRPRVGSRDLSPPPPDVSPIIKNAVSLPQLNTVSPNGCLPSMLLPRTISSPDDTFCTYGLHSGFLTLPRLSRLDRQFQDGDSRRGSLPESGDIDRTRSDSLTSFTVDLGPSLMTEVLSLIDSSSCLQLANHCQIDCEEREDEEESCSVTETPLQTPGTSMSSGSFRANMNSGGRSCSSNRTEEEEVRRSFRSLHSFTGSPQREEPVMEAERFQRAAEVLTRHYGGGSFTNGSRPRNSTTSPVFSPTHNATCTFSEEEEEIKV
ncbi:cdc42 effector protein 1-like [Genypterus blacodes]|uniref:cdc42 effector protein 1-like n=1 Tax=Genypterus blacodes TaxID=154954 RepID=UPI003F76B0B8